MKRCNCECHVRGVVGFFHCFSECCDQPDAVLYETQAEFAGEHPPLTREEAEAHRAALVKFCSGK